MLHNCMLFFITESVNSLEYFTLTSPIFLPRLLDGSSDVINIDLPGGFPFGSKRFSDMFVR